MKAIVKITVAVIGAAAIIIAAYIKISSPNNPIPGSNTTNNNISKSQGNGNSNTGTIGGDVTGNTAPVNYQSGNEVYKDSAKKVENNTNNAINAKTINAKNVVNGNGNTFN